MSRKNVLVFIPCRLESSRFPGKCLHKINNFPLFCWTYVQAKMSNQCCIVVTPDKEIREKAVELKIPSLLTSNNPKNGTERCFEALNEDLFRFMGDDDIIINVQGDMLRFDYTVIQTIVDFLSIQDNISYVSTFSYSPYGNLSNTNRVKCVIHKENEFLIVDDFCRQPFVGLTNLLHVGIYGFTKKSLRTYCQLPETENEKLRSLEQMRILDNGYKIGMVPSHRVPIVIDSKEDVDSAKMELRKQGMMGIYDV